MAPHVTYYQVNEMHGYKFTQNPCNHLQNMFCVKVEIVSKHLNQVMMFCGRNFYGDSFFKLQYSKDFPLLTNLS